MNAPVNTTVGKPLSQRKITLRAFSERMAGERHRWIDRNAYFYEDDRRYMRFLVPEGARVRMRHWRSSGSAEAIGRRWRLL
jgi:hypothetical protein